MSFHRVVVQQSDGTLEAILDFVSLRYTLTFNNANTFQLTLPATKGYDFSKFDVYQKTGGESGIIFIYRDGVLKLKGKIMRTKTDSLGNYVLIGQGWEIFLAETNTGKNKTMKAPPLADLNVATIRTNLMADIAEINIGTNEAFSGDPLGELDLSDRSYMRSINEVTLDHSNQDWSMQYKDDGSTDLINFEDNKGSTTSVITLVQGIDISNVLREVDTQNLFNKITVIGSGIGPGRIEVSVNDTTSQNKYGIREAPFPFIFKNITNSTAAIDVANKILDQAKDPLERISATVKDIDIRSSTNSVIVTGDVVTIRDPKTNLNKNVRILEETRIVTQSSEQLVYTFIDTGKRIHPERLARTLGNTSNRFSDYEAFPWESMIVSRFGIGDVTPAADTFLIASGKTISMNNIVGDVTDPVSAQDAATKNYVDGGAGGITGSGTTGRIPKWTASTVLGDSIMNESGSNIIPDTTGRFIGQAASPTWAGVTLDGFATSLSGTTTTIDIGPSGSNTTLTFTNSGAGGLTAFNAAAATASFAKVGINGSGSEALFVAGTSRFTGDITLDSSGGVKNIVPNIDNIGQIGTVSLRWNSLYLKRVFSMSADSGSGSTLFEVVSAGTGKLFTFNKTNTNASPLIELTNAGTGADIIGNAGNWNIDKNGNATFAGNMIINGNSTLGNASTDTIIATGRFASNLIPNNDTRDLGQSASPTWDNCFLNSTLDADTVAAQNYKAVGNPTVSFRSSSAITLNANSNASSTVTYGTAFGSEPALQTNLDVETGPVSPFLYRNGSTGSSTTAVTLRARNDTGTNATIRFGLKAERTYN